MLVTVLLWLAAAAVALFVAWPLLQARVGREPADAESVSPLERQKREALAAIKEAEFDRTMGKLSDEDFAALTARYRAQAMAAMSALESAQRPSGTARLAYCPQCGGKLAARANFCGGCGHALRQRAA
jgi:formate dehydrogenase maturation protein FdhE